MNSTIKDVAKKARVSTATVSRVLNGNYPVSDEVRERVADAVQSLQYKPNQIARSLKKNRTNLIGVVVADIANPFFMNVGKGLEATMAAKSYNLIFCSTNESAEKEEDIVNMLIEKKVDAIVISACSTQTTVVQRIMENRIKVVLIDRKVNIPTMSIDCITNDNFNGAMLLTEYLIQKGHRNIGIMNGILTTSTAIERFSGFKYAMNRSGIDIDERFVLWGKYSKQVAYEATERLIKTGKTPSAIVCGNNVMAEGVMRALKDYHFRIPEDISLVSFGMLANQELIEPKITCIDQSPFLMGQKAGEILLAYLANSTGFSGSEIVLNNEFLEGNSVINR